MIANNYKPMTKEFYAVVKTAIKNTNWDPSQTEIIDRVLVELDTLYKEEYKKPEPVKIEGLDLEPSMGIAEPCVVPALAPLPPPIDTTLVDEEPKIPMPDSIATTLRDQVEVLKMNKGLKFRDPGDIVMEEPLGTIDPDELHMQEMEDMLKNDIK